MCYLCSDEFDTFLLFNSFFIFARLSELMRYNLVCQTFPSALKATSNARNLRNPFWSWEYCNAIIEVSNMLLGIQRRFINGSGSIVLTSSRTALHQCEQSRCVPRDELDESHFRSLSFKSCEKILPCCSGICHRNSFCITELYLHHPFYGSIRNNRCLSWRRETAALARSVFANSVKAAIQTTYCGSIVNFRFLPNYRQRTLCSSIVVFQCHPSMPTVFLTTFSSPSKLPSLISSQHCHRVCLQWNRAAFRLHCLLAAPTYSPTVEPTYYYTDSFQEQATVKGN